MNTSVVVRLAVPDDAETIVRMMDALCAVTQDPPTGLTPEDTGLTPQDIERDGFGPTPRFIAFIAEDTEKPVGLAMAERAYASDLGFSERSVGALSGLTRRWTRSERFCFPLPRGE